MKVDIAYFSTYVAKDHNQSPFVYGWKSWQPDWS